MSLDSSPPSFAEYSRALERVQRRAALRRMVMHVDIGDSAEVFRGEEEERRDRQLLDVWERQQSGPWPGY